MLLVLYMEYRQRMRINPIPDFEPFSYKEWLDAVTEMSEEQGEQIEWICRPLDWQLGK